MDLLKLIFAILANMLINSVAGQTNGSTTVPSFMARISSHRKRSLVLPNYGSVKLTVGLGKALIGTSPKGLSSSWEISKYYAGPTTIKDLLNTEPHRSTKVSKEQKDQQKNFRKYHNLLNPHYTSLNAISKANSFRSVIFEKRLRTQTRRSSPLEETLAFFWGTDIKCSITRSICRSKEFLLPPGYSMIQDIVRIIFSMPTNANDRDSDEVNSGFCEQKSYCESANNYEHSFNFFDWILNPMKVA